MYYTKEIVYMLYAFIQLVCNKLSFQMMANIKLGEKEFNNTHVAKLGEVSAFLYLGIFIFKLKTIFKKNAFQYVLQHVTYQQCVQKKKKA